MNFVWLGIGLLVGLILEYLIFHAKTSLGTLRIDQSNPGKDVYRIELADIDKAVSKKWVVLKVDKHANLSRN